MLKIYHNPRCRKSREGLTYLFSKTQDVEVIEYLKNGLSEKELKEILLKTNLQPGELVRKQEDLYKKELKGKNFTPEEWIRIICENPRLLQRPLIVGAQKAVIADPCDKMDCMF